MKLTDMTKEELLEVIKLLSDTDCMQPDYLYSERDKIVDGDDGDLLWEQCKKYRQSLIDFQVLGE